MRDIPLLTVYEPSNCFRKKAAVIVCPGGGYSGLASAHEGHDIAKWLNCMGVTAIILEYRVGANGYKHPIPLQDAQRAIRTVRSRSGELGIEPDRIGILGFSAGGHLASTAGTHFDAGNPDSEDPVERFSSRPDFMVLCYPVIAFAETYGHTGSRINLIGEDAPQELVEHLSNERQVTADTPPTFLFHTDEDPGVPAENSVAFYLALRKAGVPAEMHIYNKGPHGVGLAKNIPGTRGWSQACEHWMENMGFLA